MNIHLVAPFHIWDLQKYSFDVILEPVINDVKILESQGLSLLFSDEPLYGTICQITGDNLGMHTVLGFNESFSSRHFCRHCLIEKDDCLTVFSEDDPKVILCGKNVFEMHCQSLQENPQLKTMYGLKNNSTLNSLKYFHVYNNNLILCVILLRELLSARSNCCLDISHNTLFQNRTYFPGFIVLIMEF